MSLISRLHIQSKDLVKSTKILNNINVVSFENNHLISSLVVGLKNKGIRTEKKEKTLGYSELISNISFKESENFEKSFFSDNKLFFDVQLDREHFNYLTGFYRKYLDEAVPIMIDGIFNPITDDPESIEKTLLNIDKKAKETEMNPANVMKSPWEGYLNDKIMNACFGDKQSIGNPLIHSPKDNFELERFQNFFKDTTDLNEIVFTGVGVDHDQFVDLIETNIGKYVDIQLLQNLGKEASAYPDKTKWKGGEQRIEFLENPIDFEKQNLPPLTSLVISFPAADIESKDCLTWLILEEILGGGFAFSAGGPGKGLSSVIYEKFLGYYPLFNMEANYQAYSDQGIFSFHASTEHEFAKYLPDAIANCISIVPQELTEENIEAAKNRLMSNVFRDLENQENLAYEITNDYLMYGEFVNTSSYIKELIESVKAEDILRCWHSSLQQSFGLTTVGDISVIPKNYQFQNVFSDIASKI